VIRRAISYALTIAGVLVCAAVTKLHSSMTMNDAGTMFGIGVALVCIGVIIMLGFPDTRRPL